MVTEYLQWQFVLAPRWLLKLFWYMELASIRFFSVTFMLRTLIAHWHKDALAYQGGGLSNLGMTFAWNMISRLIGLLIRSTIILFWLTLQIIFIPLAAFLLILFILWPMLILVILAVGLGVLFM